MKQLLISIQPQHLYNILTGKKTLEIRKQIPKGFVGWVNCYCTLGKPYLNKEDVGNKYFLVNGVDYMGYKVLNGSIPCRFWFDEYETISLAKHWNSTDDYDEYLETYKIANGELCEMSCLTDDELEDYLIDAEGYAMHIKKLEIFENPRMLGYFTTPCKEPNKCQATICYTIVTKAPQNFMYVEVEE